MKKPAFKRVTNLRLIQLIQLNLLKEVDRLTSELGIHYFLIAGSLLGAVRHKGFIPWDSDADICMFRDDYIKLVENSDLFEEDYFLQCDETDKKTKIGFARLRMKSTLFLEKGNPNENNSGNNGIYIDIFPLDKYARTNKFINTVEHYIYKYLIRLKAFKNGKKYSSSKLKTIVSFLMCYPTSFIPLNRIRSMIKHINMRFVDVDTPYINNFNSKYGLNKQYMHVNIYKPPCFIQFEKITFKAPNNYDAWLKKIYGNYMVLPKRQITHTEAILEQYDIDFGKYSKLIGVDEKVARQILNV